MQVCYAIALGFLFVTIFNKSKSLMPCIITHIVVNSLSVLGADSTEVSMYLIPIIIIIISVSYTIFINRTIKE